MSPSIKETIEQPLNFDQPFLSHKSTQPVNVYHFDQNIPTVEAKSPSSTGLNLSTTIVTAHPLFYYYSSCCPLVVVYYYFIDRGETWEASPNVPEDQGDILSERMERYENTLKCPRPSRNCVWGQSKFSRKRENRDMEIRPQMSPSIKGTLFDPSTLTMAFYPSYRLDL